MHSLGLGFGLYGDRGTLDCAKHPGALGHEVQDADFFGRHKVDWYKEDACYASGDQGTALGLYGKMRDALNATGYPVWFALCGWEPWYAPHGKMLANSARIGPDTGGGWTAVLTNIQNALPVQQYEGRSAAGGYWNDGSLQLTPGMGCGHGSDSCMTDDRFRSMYALWTIMSFNILLVGDFAKLNAFVMATWTNDWAIAINQDPRAVGATRIDGASARELLLEPGLPRTEAAGGYAPMIVQECGGEPDLQKWAWGQPAAQFVHNNATNTCLNVEGCGTTVIYDGCSFPPTSCGPASAGKYANERWNLTEQGQLKSALSPAECATVSTSTKTVRLAKCISPVPPEQTWKYSAETEQLTTGDGLCVTAARSSPGPGPAIKRQTMVLGKPLGAGAARSFALLFLNNRNQSATITCDRACLQRLDVPAVGSFVARDVWTRATLASVNSGGALSIADVPANGASVYVRLDPHGE